MDLTEQLLALTAEIITFHNLFGLSFRSVPPEDPRVSHQIEITDLYNGKIYALQANTKEDITSLLPRLLAAIKAAREIK